MKIDVLPASFYVSFLSQISKARKPSPSTSRPLPSRTSRARAHRSRTHARIHAPSIVRGLFPLEQTPGVISLLAGKPNGALFPLTGLQFTAPAPAGTGSGSAQLKVDDELLAMGLQYAPTSGIPPLIEWLTEFQELEHGRRGGVEGWRVSVTAGSQDAIYKVSGLDSVWLLGFRG